VLASHKIRRRSQQRGNAVPYTVGNSYHLGGLRHGGYVKDWSNGQIVPGHGWAPEIIRRLDEADIILLP
jgi:hypothetical protein